MSAVSSYRWKLGWIFGALCSVSNAHDIAGAWIDPKMPALARTYDNLFSTTWSDGIDSGMGVQANRGGITVVDDPLTARRKVIRIQMSRSEDFSRIANGNPRAELIFPKTVSFSQGPDYRISWSTLIPDLMDSNSTRSRLSSLLRCIKGSDWAVRRLH
jgi:hypothetical protein